MWTPAPGRADGPRYLAIVEDLAEAIRAGRLRPGERLPTHRELADRLGLALGTITRAYKEAERRGLVSGEVGRGTFVRTIVESPALLGPRVDETVIDLSLLSPLRVDEEEERAIRDLLAELSASPALPGLLAYQAHEGTSLHREAGARWLSMAGLEVAPEDVLVCASAQHASLVALSSLVGAGDAVLVEELTDPAMVDLASWMQLRLHGLPLDDEGLIPEALETACRAGVARTLYCQPALQNPTTVCMPAERRRQIAAICREHDVRIVENGVLALLAADGPPPLASFAPERSYHVTSLSKVMAPAVRVGYVAGPPETREDLRWAIRATMWMTSPLLAELGARYVADPRLPARLERRREEARARQELARRLLPAERLRSDPRAYHVWIELPEGESGASFAARARERGVALTAPDVFAAGRRPPPLAVRAVLSAARDRSALERGLGILAEMLEPQRSASGLPRAGLR